MDGSKKLSISQLVSSNDVKKTSDWKVLPELLFIFEVLSGVYLYRLGFCMFNQGCYGRFLAFLMQFDSKTSFKFAPFNSWLLVWIAPLLTFYYCGAPHFLIFLPFAVQTICSVLSLTEVFILHLMWNAGIILPDSQLERILKCFDERNRLVVEPMLYKLPPEKAENTLNMRATEHESSQDAKKDKINVASTITDTGDSPVTYTPDRLGDSSNTAIPDELGESPGVFPVIVGESPGAEPTSSLPLVS